MKAQLQESLLNELYREKSSLLPKQEPTRVEISKLKMSMKWIKKQKDKHSELNSVTSKQRAFSFNPVVRLTTAQQKQNISTVSLLTHKIPELKNHRLRDALLSPGS